MCLCVSESECNVYTHFFKYRLWKYKEPLVSANVLGDSNKTMIDWLEPMPLKSSRSRYLMYKIFLIYDSRQVLNSLFY